jgi:hypothetical protein
VFNPKGIVSISPGLQGTSYPGKSSREIHNPNGVVANVARNGGNGNGRNRVAVGNNLRTVTQGSSRLATLGFGTESLWDAYFDTALGYTVPIKTPSLY